MKAGSRVAELIDSRLNGLSIQDERAFRDVQLYGDLKEVLRRSDYRFRILRSPRWDQALFLNLTFWGGVGGDVLESRRVPADVVMHAAWHHLAARALGAPGSGRLSPAALLLGESIASAFDVYLLGRLLGSGRRSLFLDTQVPAMAEAASAAGMSEKAFGALLHEVAARPERSFAGLRALLYDVATALVGCRDLDDAMKVLVRFTDHPLCPLLHHYEISNWVLFAKAHGVRGIRPDRRVERIDAALRASDMPLAWLTSRWVAPALGR